MPTVQLVTGAGVTWEPESIRISGLAWVFFGGQVDTLTSGSCTYYGLDNSHKEVFRLACFDDMTFEPVMADVEGYCYGERVADQVLQGFTATMTVTEDMADLHYLQQWMQQAAGRFCENINNNMQTVLVDDRCFEVTVPVLFEHHYTRCDCDGDNYIGWLFFEVGLSLGAITWDPVAGLSALLTMNVKWSSTYGAYYSVMREDCAMPVNELVFKTTSGAAKTFDPMITLKTGCPYTPQWDWGDGTPWGSGINPAVHIYTDSSEKTVTLHMLHLETWLTGILVTDDDITYIDPNWTLCPIMKFVAHTNPTWTQNISGWVLPASLVEFYASHTSVTGDISSWVLSTGLAIFNVYNNSVSGNISGWVLPTGLTSFQIHSTSLSGDIGGWVLPAGLVTFSVCATLVSGNISGWVLPASLVNFYVFNNGVMSGNISGWVLPAGLVMFIVFNNSVSGNISGWVLPAGLWYFYINNTLVSGAISSWVLPAGLQYFYVYSTSVSGDIGGWVLPAGLRYFYVYSTSLSGAPSFASAVTLREFLYQDCALPQVTVDAIVQGIYNRRMSFPYATPSANIGGTNSTPSGVYAHEGPPPVTGKGFIFTLMNDENLEGFKKLVVTFSP